METGSPLEPQRLADPARSRSNFCGHLQCSGMVTKHVLNLGWLDSSPERLCDTHLYLLSTSLFAGQFHTALPSVERSPVCTFSHVTHDSGAFWLLPVTEYGNPGGKVRTDSAVVLWESLGLGNGLLFYRLP